MSRQKCKCFGKSISLSTPRFRTNFGKMMFSPLFRCPSVIHLKRTAFGGFAETRNSAQKSGVMTWQNLCLTVVYITAYSAYDRQSLEESRLLYQLKFSRPSGGFFFVAKMLFPVMEQNRWFFSFSKALLEKAWFVFISASISNGWDLFFRLKKIYFVDNQYIGVRLSALLCYSVRNRKNEWEFDKNRRN